MKKIPISLNIDDPAPVISVFYTHADTHFTRDGRPMLQYVPNSIFFDFCDVVEKYGIKGKYSVVPMPGNEGDIIKGINGVDNRDMTEWLNGVKERLIPAFSVGPEMLTHNKAIDLKTGEKLSMNEYKWASNQNEKTLTPYVEKALSMLKEAGISSCGVTSPWSFGIEVEEEYIKAISNAVYQNNGSKNAWYFLHCLKPTVKNAKPWVAYENGGRCVVSIPGTTKDHFWQTINTPDDSEAFVCSIADALITEDGKNGEIISVLENGGYPIILTHWQSLVSNGSGVGIKALTLVADRINKNLSDRVCWMSFEEIMNQVASNKKDYPKPEF